MPEIMEFSRLGSERAEKVAGRLREMENGTPPEDAIRATAAMASLCLFSWEALQEDLRNGAEGARAREWVGRARTAIEPWLANLRIVMRLAEQSQDQRTSPIPLAELRHLEGGLQRALSSANELLALVSSPPPDLAGEVRETIESAGQIDDKTEYLDADKFLARMHARKGP